MRVAIVHHWFVSQGGGERVAEALAQMYPSADIFALVADPEKIPQSLRDRSLQTSILNRIPFANRIYRQLLPLYPLAVEQIDLSAYDLILTSDSGPMKGTIVSPSAVHICYCHSPMRYLWDQYHEYRRSMGRIPRAAFSLSAHYVRTWDQRAAQQVTEFAANSCYVASRIRRYYGRESTVIYPPVDTSSGYLVDARRDAYLTVGRLVPYKRIDLLIQACNLLGRELRIIGTGPEEVRLRRQAGKTVRFLGNVDDATLWEEYAHCRAFLFAADEDFGMAVVEAQACGRPVIALGKGERSRLSEVWIVAPPVPRTLEFFSTSRPPWPSPMRSSVSKPVNTVSSRAPSASGPANSVPKPFVAIFAIWWTVRSGHPLVYANLRFACECFA